MVSFYQLSMAQGIVSSLNITLTSVSMYMTESIGLETRPIGDLRAKPAYSRLTMRYSVTDLSLVEFVWCSNIDGS